MKLTMFLVLFLHLCANVYSQGVTLLYKYQLGWSNPASWVQLNVPAGQIPIQRVPTELDDVVFSKAMSGISRAGIGVEHLSDTITVGINRTSGIRCRSMHISNTSFSVSAQDGLENYPLVLISTANGGFVLIDSNSIVMPANFYLEGGNPELFDLQLLDSEFGQIMAHNRDMGGIGIGSKGRAKLLNSKYGSFEFSSAAGGELYAENCSFNVNGFRLGANSKATILESTFTDVGPSLAYLAFGIGPHSDFTSSGIEIKAFSNLYLYTSGSVLNGNISTMDYQGGLHLQQEDPAHPLPNIINGSLRIFGQGVNLSGDLKLSGNLINYADELDMYPDSSHVYINGQHIFKIGGIANYGNDVSTNNCTQPGCHFKVEFFGEGNSNLVWPVGFPVDTLVINKTNCAKVTFENSLYVSGETRIQGGQLVLNPNDTIPYKFVSAGDVKISQGGGIFLRRNASGLVANMAVAGNIYDQNTVVDSTCTGLSNPYNGTVTLYKSSLNPGDHTVVLASNASIGDMNLISDQDTDTELGSDLTVNNFTFTNPGKLWLGDHRLTINGALSGYGPANYFVTNGTGKLQRTNVGNNETIFPVGPSAASYNPATIINSGTPDDFWLNVKAGVLSGGTTGSPYTTGVVNRTWNVEEAIPGGSNATIKLQWNGADELTGFARTATYLAHYTSGAWDKGPQMAASGMDPFTLTRTNITTFSPFAVMSESPTLPLRLLEFGGQYKEAAVDLHWITESEVNTQSFTVERSFDQVRFTALSTIAASNRSQGRTSYQFRDNSSLQNINYYRLKTTDLDGSFTYSKIITVALPSTQAMLLFPNPVKDQLFIRLLPGSTTIMIQIADLRGQIIKMITPINGSNVLSVNTADLPKGIYTVTISTEKGKKSVQVVKQ